jgi:2-dehydro-3-deoxyphosphogluconate aldolase/(4S)-4-hydroxy-2-oxoglutarate aldolase
MSNVMETIEQAGIVPVIKMDSARHAAPLARTLSEAGLPIAEITFRTDAAEAAIRAVAQAMPDVMLGAGTVVNVDQAKAALDAGARFIVAPGFNPKVVDYCIQQNVPVMPGVSTPTDIEMGLDRGLRVLKFFPAEAAGGTKMLKALSGPYKEVRFVPTGGIKPENLGEYLSLPSVVACGGSWIVPQRALSEERFDEIDKLVREALELVAQARKQNG